MSNLTSNLWVDADSCPVQKEIVNVSKVYGWTPRFVATINHFRSDLEGQHWTFLDHGDQNVDLYILNHVQPLDIVITQDLSLAVLLTSKRVYVLTPRGKLVTEDDATQIMDSKHLRQKTLKKKKKWKGPSAFTDRDREEFSRQLEKIMSDHEGIL
ncbi:DUF188 domain-containing protein [Halobacillus locisalis]|uniref:UPF0178 protein H0266_01495 n=1 Tax=Halobacillus locisalis TaxID=220753 RepID=A0A838CPJ8_9BACI|nr:DUF188 domain-containing protein [Halobacillus locisalis]MBA2173566.1 DUF188 domain-containing protein [Halobacillus locisalis]